MSTTLQEMRRAAGFKSSKDFAESMGLAAPTYARYEQSPEKIPLDKAWQLADRFGCSIDAVVGRAPVDDVQALRGPVQKAYDALSPASQELAGEFMEFLAQKETSERKARKEKEEARWREACESYERIFAQQAASDAALCDRLAFGGEAAWREEFEKFLVKRAQTSGGAEGEEGVRKIMAAYDVAHGTAPKGGTVEYAVVDLRQ